MSQRSLTPELSRSRSIRPVALGFTLIEMLVSVAVLMLILGLLLSFTSAVQKTWKSTEAKVEQFREARVAFEAINRSVRQALLNTYWDYDDPNNPTEYVRRSELRFISGPVANLTLNSPFPGSTAYGHGIFFQSVFGKSDDHPEARPPPQHPGLLHRSYRWQRDSTQLYCQWCAR